MRGPRKVGVIGDPVAHSLSPALHQPALDALGIPAVYERWHTPAHEIAQRIESLRQPEMLGANVTVPHKLAALRLVDEASTAAKRVGAVNTVVNRDGTLFGDNTDIHGLAMAAREAIGDDAPSVAIVLGAGGAARAVVVGLESLGVSEIVVANRDPARAAALARDLAPTPMQSVALTRDDLAPVLPRAGMIINATSLGWRSGESPIDPEWLDLLPQTATVLDLTYRDTDLLRAAAARNLRAVDGLSMLVHQGARAFELFTGQPAPLAIMLRAAREARHAS